jgi:hypothetical protein
LVDKNETTEIVQNPYSEEDPVGAVLITREGTRSNVDRGCVVLELADDEWLQRIKSARPDTVKFKSRTRNIHDGRIRVVYMLSDVPSPY